MFTGISALLVGIVVWLLIRNWNNASAQERHIQRLVERGDRSAKYRADNIASKQLWERSGKAEWERQTGMKWQGPSPIEKTLGYDVETGEPNGYGDGE